MLGKTFQHLQPLLIGWVGTAARQTVRTFFGTLFSPPCWSSDMRANDPDWGQQNLRCYFKF